MLYLDLSIQLLFFLKDNITSLSVQYKKDFNIKNIKIKPPVALFKKKSMKLYLFLKAKSQTAKKSKKKKIGTKFLELIYFVFASLKVQLNPDFLNSQGTDKVVQKIGGSKNRMIQKKGAH